MDDAVAEQIRAVVEARLRELQPALAELEQLQGVLAALEGAGASERLGDLEVMPLPHPVSLGKAVGAPMALAPVTPLRSSTRHGSKRGSDGRAPQGANKQRILAAVAEHPGIAAPQIAKLTGLKRPLVASTISRLKRTGELQPHGNGVQLPSHAPTNGVALESRR